ncbi:MAG: coenzyme F420-0:L-glutamate ligase [Methanomethylovorans sp.]|nr:coenzyme F420-0:L-glutamate ligase [Methanomethylovorans sp.]
MGYGSPDNNISIQLIGIRTPIIKPGEDIVKILLDSLKKHGIKLLNGDVIVLAESAVATSEGRVVSLCDIHPTVEAFELALKYQLDPREMQLIIEECDEIFGGVPGAALTITRGTLSANAGIDSSNAPEGCVVLLPKDPQKSAALIKEGLEKAFYCRIGVIVGDSRTQPLRLGCVGIALGTAGIEPVVDARGELDLFGKELKITRKAVADNMVSAAQLVMGEAGEGIPAVIIRGAPVKIIEGSVEMPLFSREECMYYSNISKSSK